MPQFSGRFGKYHIGPASAPSTLADADDIRDMLAVQTVLRRCVGDDATMRLLRTLIAGAQGIDPPRQLNDVAVIDLASRLVGCGRLRLMGPAPRPRVVKGVPRVVAVAGPPPASRPAPAPASAPRPEVAESPFAPDFDAAAIAASLKEASKNGTPFCAECALARAVAA